MRDAIYITGPGDPLVAMVLEQSAGRINFEVVSNEDEPRPLSGFDAVLVGDGPLRARLSHPGGGGPRLVQLTRGHHRDVDAAGLAASGVTVAGAAPVLARNVAEHAIGLAVAAALPDGPRGMLSRDVISRVKGGPQANPFAGKTVGIVGFGRVGQAVAAAAKLRESRLLYADIRTASYDRSKTPPVRRSTLDLLLANSDFVFLCVQWGPTSNPMIEHRELRLLKDGSVLVNAADARLVDGAALGEALRSGRIRAGLDIEEPMAGEIAALPGTVVTPYVAARSQEADRAVARFVVDNIERALAAPDPASAAEGIVEIIDFPRAGDPAFWSSKMAPRASRDA